MQNYKPPIQARYPQRNLTVYVAQIGYDPNIITEGEQIDDYVENVQGELVLIYYTTT